jgi:hypothetical protein
VTFGQRRLLGESLREIGVLVFVFVPLEMLLQSKGDLQMFYPSWMWWMHWLPLPRLLTLFFASAGIILRYYGIKIEDETTIEAAKGDN